MNEGCDLTAINVCAFMRHDMPPEVIESQSII